MYKVSVIIPIFNGEKYLKECLDSIVNQTLKEIEIICVNDGSEDASEEILKSYQKKDNRIKIISQENRGIGPARNSGFKTALGKYVYFIDCDDFLELTGLEELYNIAEEKSADYIMFKPILFDEDKIIHDDYYEMPYLKEKVNENTFNYEDVADIALKLNVCSHECFYKREFIKDISFPPLQFEDNVFFTETLFKADRIYFYDRHLYHRRIRSDSVSHTITLNSLDTIEITNLIFDLIKKYRTPKKYKKQLYKRIFKNIYVLYKKADDDFKDELFSEIKKRYLNYTDKWKSDKYFNKKLNPKLKNIYLNVINSESAEEFEEKMSKSE